MMNMSKKVEPIDIQAGCQQGAALSNTIAFASHPSDETLEHA
jgi:hypothetical protein